MDILFEEWAFDFKNSTELKNCLLCDGVDKITGTKVVLKILKITDAPSQRRLLHALRSLREDHIERCLHFDTKLDNLYIICERPPGAPLSAHLKQSGPFAQPTVRAFMRQISQGLHHIHSRGLVHRNLTLSSLFLSEPSASGTLKIVDFQSAELSDPEQPACLHSVVGTPSYMAPEVLLQVPYNYKCDLWSLGIVMYKLLTGDHPFIKGTFKQYLLSLKSLLFHPIPSCEGPTNELLGGLLERDVEERWDWERILGCAFFEESRSDLGVSEELRRRSVSSESPQIWTQIFYCLFSDIKVIDIELSSHDTVEDTKNKFEELLSIPPEDQFLISSEFVFMKEKCLIADYRCSSGPMYFIQISLVKQPITPTSSGNLFNSYLKVSPSRNNLSAFEDLKRKFLENLTQIQLQTGKINEEIKVVQVQIDILKATECCLQNMFQEMNQSYSNVTSTEKIRKSTFDSFSKSFENLLQQLRNFAIPPEFHTVHKTLIDLVNEKEVKDNFNMLNSMSDTLQTQITEIQTMLDQIQLPPSNSSPPKQFTKLHLLHHQISSYYHQIATYNEELQRLPTNMNYFMIQKNIDILEEMDGLFIELDKLIIKFNSKLEGMKGNTGLLLNHNFEVIFKIRSMLLQMKELEKKLQSFNESFQSILSLNQLPRYYHNHLNEILRRQNSLDYLKKCLEKDHLFYKKFQEMELERRKYFNIVHGNPMLLKHSSIFLTESQDFKPIPETWRISKDQLPITPDHSATFSDVILERNPKLIPDIIPRERELIQNFLLTLVDKKKLAKLMALGFLERSAQNALLMTSNGSIEDALKWLEKHKGDPRFYAIHLDNLLQEVNDGPTHPHDWHTPKPPTN